MRFQTPGGHYVASGELPNASYRVEWDADGKFVSESLTIKAMAASKPPSIPTDFFSSMDDLSLKTKSTTIPKPCGCGGQKADK